MVEDYKYNYTAGYISVYRSVLNNSFWTSEKFTRGQAWVDLLLLAKYKDGFFYKREIKVNYKRGDVTEGIVNLGKRWKWSRNKTQKFINDLEKEQQVEQQKTNVITLISILNYDVYQKKGHQIKQQQDTSRTPSDTTAGHQQDTHNKVNKDNKVNKVNNKPEFSEFFEYAKTKKPLVSQVLLKQKYSAWIYNGWKDGNGKEIKNWKAKLNNTLPYIGEEKKFDKNKHTKIML